MKISKSIFLAIVLLAVFYPVVQAQQPCKGPDLVAGRPKINELIKYGKVWLEARSYITNIGTEPFLHPIEVRIAVKKMWMSGRDAYEEFTGYSVSRVDVNQQISVWGIWEFPKYKKWGCQALMAPECCREVEVIVYWRPRNPGDKDCRPDNDRCPDIPENHVKFTSDCFR